MQKYASKGNGEACTAVQWDGSMGHAKGIGFHIEKHSPDYSLAILPGMGLKLTDEATASNSYVIDGDWILFYDRGIVTKMTDELFSSIYEPAKEPSNG